MTCFSRREFLKQGALITAGAVGAATMGTGLITAAPAQAAGIKFAETSCGAGSTGKILVAYASRCGSTGGVAEAIGKVLCRSGAAVDVRLIEHVKDLAPYGAVVVGSAVRRGAWLYEAIDFVGKNRRALSRMPTAYFLTCLAMSRPGDQTRAVARSYMDSVIKTVPEVRPRDMGLFAGALDYTKIRPFMRGIMRSKMAEKGIKEGDYRDFAAVRAWAGGLAAKIAPGRRAALQG